MNIVIIDDDKLVAVSLKTILESTGSVKVLAMGSCGEEAIELYSLLKPDVLLMDIRMNGMSHASEFVAQMDEKGWKVSEQPVDILYTEYSMSKGQSLINGVNILSDGLLARKLP